MAISATPPAAGAVLGQTGAADELVPEALAGASCVDAHLQAPQARSVRVDL